MPRRALVRFTHPTKSLSVPRTRGTSLATVRPCLVHRELDIPAPRLAPLIGSWPEPALLESGPGFGGAGRWSILAARPRLVFEANGRAWSLRTGTRPGRIETGEGDVLDALARLLHDHRLADPGDEPDPD